MHYLINTVKSQTNKSNSKFEYYFRFIQYYNRNIKNNFVAPIGYYTVFVFLSLYFFLLESTIINENINKKIFVSLYYVV